MTEQPEPGTDLAPEDFMGDGVPGAEPEEAGDEDGSGGALSDAPGESPASSRVCRDAG